MIIWGSTGLKSVVGAASFHCPGCDRPQTANLKQVRNFFTLYFIPVIPLNVAGRYVECTSCGGTFTEAALSHDPEKERAETFDQLLRVMIMSGLADGRIDEMERAEIRKQYQELSGLPVPTERLENEIALAMVSGSDLNSYVGQIAPSLSPHGKAMVVKLAWYTMSASGELQPGHESQLMQLAKTLRIPADQFMELINLLSEPASE